MKLKPQLKNKQKINTFQIRLLIIFFSIFLPVILLFFALTSFSEIKFYREYTKKTAEFFTNVIENSITDSLYFEDYSKISDIFDMQLVDTEICSCRIYDKRGILIANSCNDSSKFSFSPSTEGLAVINSHDDEIPGNSSYIFFSKKVILGNQVLGGIVIEFSKNQIRAEINKMLSVFLTADILIFIVGSLIFTHFARTISRPIAQLSRVVSAYRSHNFDPEIEYSRNDELGNFAAALKEMAQELKKSFNALKKSDERYNLAVCGANTGIWDYQVETDLLYVSQKWKEIFNIDTEKHIKSVNDWFDRIVEYDRDKVKKVFKGYISGQLNNLNMEYRIQTSGGSIYKWVSSSGRGIFDNNGKCIRLAGSVSDISIQKESEERLIEAALFDPLTKLPNRMLLLERLKNAAEGQKRNTERHFALLYLDYDGFKGVNDTYGHPAGDLLLVSIANRLKECIRGQDMVCRIGGDEFVILLEDCSIWKEVVNRVIDKSSNEFLIDNCSIFLTVSVGVVTDDIEYRNVADLVQFSDIAMYNAKKSRKGSYSVYKKDMHAELQKKWQLDYDLHKALTNNELYLVHQPVVDLNEEMITGFESLLRWNHPTRGFISPGDFLPIAEESGYITDITDWVLNEITDLLKSGAIENNDFRFALNISSKDFTANPDIFNRLAGLMRSFPFLADRLDIEVTETSLIKNFEKGSQQLADIRDMGLKVKLDDFGTGFSSLSYLHSFPLDCLKIDRSFIMTLPENKENLSIIKHLINLSHDLGYFVIAEGIENIVQHDLLKKLGCDRGQGFFYSRPLMLKDLNIKLKDPDFPPFQ